MIPSYIKGAIRDLEDLSPSVITVEGIAGALAKVNRFNGQTSYPYSVAQHSVLVSHLVQPKQAIEALFHDAAEAFVGDLSKWIKPMCPGFNTLEDLVDERICEVLCLSPDHEEIKRGDLIALRLEQMYIQKRTTFYEWEPIDMPSEAYLYAHLTHEMTWRDAFLMFMVRHAELTWGVRQ